MSKVISIIIPIYNEEAAIPIFLKKLTPILKLTTIKYELIFIDDGSNDDSVGILKTYLNTYNIKIISFSRNFGKEAALMAGLEHASGDAAIPIDVDLQDPPELIPQFIEKWLNGAKQVIAVRRQRLGDSWLKRSTAKWFYRFFNSISEHHIPFNAGDYRLIDRQVINTIITFKEKNRFLKGLFSWSGFKQDFVFFDRTLRKNGKSAWSYLKLWRFALDGIISFSNIPLKVWSYIGFLISSISGIMIIYLIAKTLLLGRDVPGYASIMVTILFMGGIQLLSLGIIGEYIARIYTETKNRPLYIIEGIYHNADSINETNLRETISS